LALVQQAPAQTADEQTLERVVVTGTNIRRAETAQAENVQVITAEDIKRSGQPTVADFLRTITANFAAFNETFTNSFAPGAGGIALRGLSQKNTLVLLNGRRIANFGFAQNLEDTFVDLNIIPTIAVERIEILKSGAAAIYGSDATAGVVNIILKQNSTDRIIDAGVSTTTGGGGATRDASLAWGFGDYAADGYNLYATGTLFKRDDLIASQRPYTAAQNFSNQPNGFLAWIGSANYTNSTNTVNTAFPNCGGLFPGQQTLNMNQFPTSVTGTTCAYNPANQLSLIPESQRANLTATGNFRITSDWKAFGDVFYSNEKTAARFTPSGLGPTSIAYNPTTGGVSSVSNVLPAGNPSNPFGTPTQIDYVFTSVGGRDYEVLSNTYRVTGGVKGTWMTWDWEAAYGHSENHVTQTNYNSISVSALGNAIANGSFNFLDPAATPAANSAIRANWEDSSVSKLDTIGAKGNGTVLQLPAGPLDVAFGVELRHESIDNVPSSQLLAGDILNYGLAEVDGGRTVYAAYAELSVPIFKSLDADLAAREEHYSDVGGNFSPQASLRWQPVKEFTARVVGSRGFRAPSLPEISHASSTSFQSVTDPTDPLGRPTESIGVVTQANPQLRPETSKNVDFGIVFSPTHDINLSIDYYKIMVDHVIATETTSQNIVDNPGNYPGQIFRTPSGILSYVTIPYENLYQIETAGVDFEGDALFKLGRDNRLRFKLDAIYITDMQVNNGQGWTQYAGTNGWLYLSPISGGGPMPHWKAHLTGAWENNDWVAQATFNYIDGYANSCFTIGFCTQSASQVPSYPTLDLYGEYNGLKNWKISASIINVANREPPFDWFAFAFSGYEGYDTTLYDARGRVFQLRAQFRF
jgi:iron complex outermembrane receptor protein